MRDSGTRAIVARVNSNSSYKYSAGKSDSGEESYNHTEILL